MKTEREARDEVIDVCQRMHSKGYVAATDGNVSVRLSEDRILTTPAGLPKGSLRAEQLIVVDMSGNPVYSRFSAPTGVRGAQAPLGSEDQRPSTELRMHLCVYRERPDVFAVVHAHPPISVAFTVAGLPLPGDFLPEVIVTLGQIPTAPYATPGTEAVPASIRNLILTCDALLLAHHGSLTVGKDALEAYLKLEKVEHAATVALASHLLGTVRPLPPEEVSRLSLRRLGLPVVPRAEGASPCAGCLECQEPSLTSRPRPWQMAGDR